MSRRRSLGGWLMLLAGPVFAVSCATGETGDTGASVSPSPVTSVLAPATAPTSQAAFLLDLRSQDAYRSVVPPDSTESRLSDASLFLLAGVFCRRLDERAATMGTARPETSDVFDSTVLELAETRLQGLPLLPAASGAATPNETLARAIGISAVKYVCPIQKAGVG